MSTETCRADLKKIIKRKSCCILLAVYIAVLVMHGHTNIKFMCVHGLCYRLAVLRSDYFGDSTNIGSRSYQSLPYCNSRHFISVYLFLGN